MGAKCCAESKQDVPTEVPDTIKDLPAIDFSGIRDPYCRFEASMPFSRTLVTVFIAKVDEAVKECGDESHVTLEALRKHLNTPSW